MTCESIPDSIERAGDAFDDALQRFIADRMSSEEEAEFRAAHSASNGSSIALDGCRSAFHALTRCAERIDHDLLWADLQRRIAEAEPLATRVKDARIRRSFLQLSRRPSRTWRHAVITGVAAVVAFASLLLLRHQPDASAVVMREMITARGESATLTLSDGTPVRLAPASTLQYPSAFGSRSRDVLLSGEAYFDVVHDPNRPFRVHARDVIAEDIGTAFQIRSYADDPFTQVVVSSGSVALRDRTHQPIGRALVAGEIGEVRHGLMETRTVDPEAYAAWTHGRLVFTDAPLGEVLPELSRWSGLDISTPDSSLVARRVNLEVRLGPADVMLGLLTTVLRVHIVRHGRFVQLLSLRR